MRAPLAKLINVVTIAVTDVRLRARGQSGGMLLDKSRQETVVAVQDCDIIPFNHLQRAISVFRNTNIFLLKDRELIRDTVPHIHEWLRLNRLLSNGLESSHRLINGAFDSFAEIPLLVIG